jgi:glycerol kinase
MTKSTYGTGCFLLMNTGDEVLQSSHKLLSTVAYRLQGKPSYAMEGSIFMAGATMQWLRDQLHLFNDTSETEALASKAQPGPVRDVCARIYRSWCTLVGSRCTRRHLRLDARHRASQT